MAYHHPFPPSTFLRRPLIHLPSRSPHKPAAWTRRYAQARGKAQTLQLKERPQAKVDLTKLEASQLPKDLGLFEGTFIMPTGQNRPSFFSAPRERLKLWWVGMKNRVGEFGSLLIYKTITKPRLKLRLGQTSSAALSLHKAMYQAFADGDVTTLRRICGEGLLTSFVSRISARGVRDRYVWKLHKYTKFARVVSNRAVRLPLEDAGQRQAVVRIQSRQSLTRYGPDGNVVPGSGAEKEVSEYVVIQKRVIEGKEGPWFVWGTTEETSLEDVERAERRRRGED